MVFRLDFRMNTIFGRAFELGPKGVLELPLDAHDLPQF